MSLFYRRRRYILGVALVLLNSLVIDILAFAFCPVVIIAPLSALVVVFSSFFAVYGILVERERLTRSIFASNAMIAFGIAIGSGYGPHRQEQLSIHELTASMVNPMFIAYLIPSIFITGASIGVICARRHLSSRARVLLHSTAAASSGALSVICWKAFAILLRGEIESNTGDIFGKGGFFFFLGATAFGPLNVFLAGSALDSEQVQTAVPIFQAVVTLNVIIGGGIFYKEFDGMTASEMRATAGGTLLCLIGLITKTAFGDPSADEDDAFAQTQDTDSTDQKVAEVVASN